MTRSSKKAPYVEERLMERILRMNENNERRMLKTWSRSSVIYPEFVGHTVAVHDGRKHVPVFCTESMVGHKLGEVDPTRTFRTQGKRDRTPPWRCTRAASTCPSSAPKAWSATSSESSPQRERSART